MQDMVPQRPVVLLASGRDHNDQYDRNAQYDGYDHSVPGPAGSP